MKEVAVTKRDGVVELRLDRPEKKNALTFAMYDALREALDAADRDEDVRAVVLTASGDVFCAGNDVSDFLALGGAKDIDGTPGIRFIKALVRFGKPLVAAVAGRAVGVGATLLLHCDLVYAAETAQLSMPFVSLGLVPEAASTLLLPRRVGHAIANEILLLGTAIDAKRAASLGIVNEVVPAGDLVSFAHRKAAELARQPPGAMRATKGLLRGDSESLLARVDVEGRLFAEALGSTEAREAFMAFLQRRSS